MNRSFSTTPLRTRARSGLGAFNGLNWALALEQWNISSADVLLLGDSGGSPGAPGVNPFPSAQSPAAAVAAAAGLVAYGTASWPSSIINTFDTLSGWSTPYGGFPEPAQGALSWPGSPWPVTPGHPTTTGAAGYPVATGTYTNMGNWGGQQLNFIDQTGSGDQMFSATGLVSFPEPFLANSLYPMPGSSPGQPGTVGGVIGPLTATLMSNWCFAPLYMPAVPDGSSGYLWANCQFAGRTRYRLQHPFASLGGLRLNCELWVRNTATAGWPATGWGASAADWSNYPGTTSLVITSRNFNFNSYLKLPSHAPLGSTNVTSDWTEIPLPAIPSGWTAAQAATNAATGFMGLATMDFWGYRTRAQWENATGLTITG